YSQADRARLSRQEYPDRRNRLAEPGTDARRGAAVPRQSGALRCRNSRSGIAREFSRQFLRSLRRTLEARVGGKRRRLLGTVRQRPRSEISAWTCRDHLSVLEASAGQRARLEHCRLRGGVLDPQATAILVGIAAVGRCGELRNHRRGSVWTERRGHALRE